MGWRIPAGAGTLALLLLTVGGARLAAAQEAPGAGAGTARARGEIEGRVILTDPTRREVREAPALRARTPEGVRETQARVTLMDGLSGETLRTLFADAGGAFRVQDLEPLRKYRLRAERRGYQSAEAEVTVAVDRKTEVTLRMPARKTVWWYFVAGGELMWVLLAISVVVVYVAAERGWFLLMHLRADTGKLLDDLRRGVLGGNPDGASASLAGSPSPVARVLRAGLACRDAGRVEVEKTMENEALQQVTRLERGLAVLAISSGLAPIVGFLGTVVGMIQAFDAVAEHGLGDPSYVADGISVALITTAGGLFIAVFALPAYHFFNGLVSDYARQMETAGNVLLETLEHQERDRERARRKERA